MLCHATSSSKTLARGHQDIAAAAHLVCNRLLLDAADEHMHSVVHDKLRRDALDFLRPRCGKEERLPLPRQLRHNLLDLRLKAHVQHAVSLVQDQVRDLGHADLLRGDKIVEAARGGNDHLDAALDCTKLGPLWRAAIQASAA